jgi:hypothetical protein
MPSPDVAIQPAAEDNFEVSVHFLMAWVNDGSMTDISMRVLRCVRKGNGVAFASKANPSSS